MRVIRYTGDDGSKNYSAIPTSTKELARLFSVYGIHAFPVKYGGRYDICCPGSKEQGGPVFLTNIARTVQDMTCKRWLAIADKNCPERNRGEKDILWTELKRYVELETLESTP